mgnify:CR=1 FL=1
MSLQRLNQLGYFEEIKTEDAEVKPSPTEPQVDINLKVKEKGRNSIGFNGGVSGIGGSFTGSQLRDQQLPWFRRNAGGQRCKVERGNRNISSASQSLIFSIGRSPPVSRSFNTSLSIRSGARTLRYRSEQAAYRAWALKTG